MQYSGLGKLIGIRYKTPSFEPVNMQNFLVDMMIGEKDILRNLNFNMMESYGEIPVLGNMYWILVNEKEMKIIDDID